MKTIGIYNIKGGVGKTATAVNLSYLASMTGYKTLLWDLDPQGASTFYFHKKQGINLSLKKIISGKGDVTDIVKKTDYINLRIIPSDFSFRNIDSALDDVKKSRKRLSAALEQFENDFQLVFLDCPPGISLLAENIFYACDYILVPTIPSPLSIRTYNQIVQFFNENDLDTTRILPFFSMVEIRRNIHKNLINNFQKDSPNICKTIIPYLSDIEKMGIYLKPVVQFNPSSKASVAYKDLWEEIEKRIF